MIQENNVLNAQLISFFLKRKSFKRKKWMIHLEIKKQFITKPLQ